MFTFDLARELDPEAVTANCLHPATYMATTMVRQSGVTPISTVGEGAEAILNLAMADELDGRSGHRDRNSGKIVPRGKPSVVDQAGHQQRSRQGIPHGDL